MMSSAEWTKGAANADGRVNIWSLNGFGEPVFTGSMYSEDEVRTLQVAVEDYCKSNDVTVSQLCGGADHTVHNKRIRGAWQVIAQSLPHRTVLSVYRKALRRFHTHTRGKWTEDEIRTLLRLVELHGRKWKSIQDKLGRSATDCRLKFFDLTDGCKRGKWSLDEVEALLKAARSALNVPRDDMDVREINQWTLDHNTKLPFTSLCHQVKRRRQDCYFKWKQLTKRSNKKASELGLEGVPMARETIKFDVRSEYLQWKAEQDPSFREQYASNLSCPNSEGRMTEVHKKGIGKGSTTCNFSTQLSSRMSIDLPRSIGAVSSIAAREMLEIDGTDWSRIMPATKTSTCHCASSRRLSRICTVRTGRRRKNKARSANEGVHQPRRKRSQAIR